ncbi:AraC family transcriptional regulator [Ideonella livida]|uniref:Helix-turn-helix transcriptional regulator n=1 Tax=Ideonella livida TaxID=2707176 RepID=A0A7C9TKI2_9BURK|nr:helix-turn-helix transcriptional regulator [Ideonella livida]NDY92839.1 helix-turn-helix transcriptional regulator [Ideonella livida]
MPRATPRRPAAAADQKTPAQLVPPYPHTLPAPLVFRSAQLEGQAEYPVHSHRWGEFVYSFSGVMEVRLAGQQVLAPPQLGIWLPPQVEHQGLNRQAAAHSSLYVAPELCGALPAQACALVVSPLARALLEHLRTHTATSPTAHAPSAEEHRLLQVLVDQLAHAQRVRSYLPHSTDPLLAPVLQALEADPADNRPLSAWAAQVHSTERTLSRRCQRELGMSFVAWRQRLRVLTALGRLARGEKVTSLALDLGYASASAFIAMFRKLTGLTPEACRPSAG